MPGRPIRGYRDLAAVLREDITTGRLAPGARVPSESTLMQTYGLARDTVRDAVGLLRDEGLIVVRHGRATRVREQPEKETIVLEPGQSVETRMPSPAERDRLGLDAGVPVFVLSDPDGWGDLLPGDRFRVVRPTE